MRNKIKTKAIKVPCGSWGFMDASKKPVKYFVSKKKVKKFKNSR